MRQIKKLKRDNKFYIGIFYTLNGLLAVLLASFNKLELYMQVLSVLLLAVVLVNLLFALRTKNLWYGITALHYTVILVFFWGASLQNRDLVDSMKVAFLFTLILILFCGITRKVKWRREEILELAALPIDECQNGFTGRPHPTGTAEYSEREIENFARFMLRHLMAVPYREKNRLVLALTGHYIDHILNIRNDYSEDSWVAFDDNGNISVSIIKNDYLQYKDELTFDQLCLSLGDLFKEWLELFKNGEEIRIIKQLNDLKLSPFTGGLVGF